MRTRRPRWNLNEFQNAFTAELGAALAAHYHDRYKHFDESMPEPEDLASDVGRWLAEKFIHDMETVS